MIKWLVSWTPICVPVVLWLVCYYVVGNCGGMVSETPMWVTVV